MSESFEYAIRKDVRNNPIVREVDETRHRELWKSVAIVVLFVGVVMFAGLQRIELWWHGRHVETLQQELQREDEISRRLKVDIEELGAPDRLESEAKKLNLVTPADAVIIDLVTPTALPTTEPTGAVVARR